MQLEGKDLAELINDLDQGFISIEVFGMSVREAGHDLNKYVPSGTLKEVAIEKVVAGAMTEKWMPQLLEAILRSERTESNTELRRRVEQLLTRLTCGSEPLLKKAFVIQSIDQGGSPTRKRADRMFEELIRPACAAAGFDAERADKYPTRSIMKPITSPLFGHPMALADLGNLSSVSPDVMSEVGFRRATGGPLLFLADAPLPENIPSHLPQSGQTSEQTGEQIIKVDPSNPGASLDELVSCLRAYCAPNKQQGKEEGWTSEHAWVDWQWSLYSPSVYLDANEKAAFLYGRADVNEIIGQSVQDINNQLIGLMDPAYRAEFEAEQKAIFGSIMESLNQQEPLTTTATLPLIFTNHPHPDIANTIHLPLIANYKIDEGNHSIVFRTVFLRIDRWCPKDLAERRVEYRKIPALFREIYEHDFFLCYDNDDFLQAKGLKEALTRVGFDVWWPSDKHNKAIDKKISAVTLKAELAKTRIAAVLVGSFKRGRWGEPELDEALYRHCDQQKPLILVMLPNASGFQPEGWLGPRDETLLSEPLYINWSDAMRLLSGDTPSSSLERTLAEVVKLAHLPGGNLKSLLWAR